MSDNDIYWAVLRKGTQHELYLELEDQGRNRWACVVGTDEFYIRTKSKDPVEVLRLALETHQERSLQDLP